METVWPQSQKYLLPGPLKKKFADPYIIAISITLYKGKLKLEIENNIGEQILWSG